MKKIISTLPSKKICPDQVLLSGRVLQSIIKALPVSVIMFDNELRFLAASDRFFEHSPLKKSDVQVYDYWYDLIPDMPEKWREIHQRCLRGESFRSEEDAFCRSDGSVEWWKWEVTPWLNDSHTTGGLILYAENITEQKKREKNLRKKVDRLSESNTDLSEFAHACAHDLYAPLRTMSNYLQLMRADLPIQPDKFKDYYQVVMHAADYMKNMIYRILYYTDAHHEKMQKIWFNFEDVVKGVITSLKAEIDAHKAEIIFEDLGVLYADPPLISQVIQNLLVNALKYNESPVPQIHISMQDKNRVWHIQVKDNGIGIHKMHREIIFKAYHRIDSTNKSGSGLGLYRCKKIIKDHHGKMWVTPIAQGSIFNFTLPKDYDEDTE